MTQVRQRGACPRPHLGDALDDRRLARRGQQPEHVHHPRVIHRRTLEVRPVGQHLLG
jgi:hypothetical protein